MKHFPFPNPQPYYEQVWELVRQVPKGTVVTYGQVAELIPAPDEIEPEDYQAFGPRWVGNAMAACPHDVPWQRVINSQGKISQRAGAQRQQQLLEEEGIMFVNNKISSKVYQWHGPGSEIQPRQARLL